jgi:carbamoyl-phosphate synthase small subunit
MRNPALLALEDGTVFEGCSFGATGTATGEICFNTSMTGYQEVLTDPSYHGQIVAMTTPHIGNTGVNLEDEQSARPWPTAFVVRELTTIHSSWRANGGLDDYLKTSGVPGMTEVDTRRLVRHLRRAGAMKAAVSDQVLAPDDLIDIAKSAPGLVGRDLASEVTTPRPYSLSCERPRARVAAFDFGIKRKILDLLVAARFEVTVLPATTPHEAVLAGGFDAVFFSNGPGDPEPLEYAVETVKGLVGRLPVLGICLGHQLLGLALGASTYKLPFGHRGGNHPVRRIGHDRVEITCQNHGFAVSAASLAMTPARITHTNLNDGTVEGFAVEDVCFGVQYHPESSPGPHDSRYVFEEFATLIDQFEPRIPSVSARV